MAYRQEVWPYWYAPSRQELAVQSALYDVMEKYTTENGQVVRPQYTVWEWARVRDDALRESSRISAAAAPVWQTQPKAFTEPAVRARSAFFRQQRTQLLLDLLKDAAHRAPLPRGDPLETRIISIVSGGGEDDAAARADVRAARDERFHAVHYALMSRNEAVLHAVWERMPPTMRDVRSSSGATVAQLANEAGNKDLQRVIDTTPWSA